MYGLLTRMVGAYVRFVRVLISVYALLTRMAGAYVQVGRVLIYVYAAVAGNLAQLTVFGLTASRGSRLLVNRIY